MGQKLFEDSQGLISKASATAINVAASRLTVGGRQLASTSTIQINLATTGANGLDTGSLAADTLYYIYGVNNSGVLAFVASTNSSAPTGFAGYKEVGRFVTYNGTAEVAEVGQKDVLFNGWKQYTDADVTITSDAAGGSGYTIDDATLMPYKTADGLWRLSFNLNMINFSDTAFTITIPGVTFSFVQSLTLATSSDNVTSRARASGSGSLVIGCSAAVTQAYVSGDVALSSKPTWANYVDLNI